MAIETQSAIRTVYLYLVTFIGLILLVVGTIDLVEFLLGLVMPDKTPTSGEYQYYGNLRSGIAYVIIGTPIWLYHWRLIQWKKSSAFLAETKPAAEPAKP